MATSELEAAEAEIRALAHEPRSKRVDRLFGFESFAYQAAIMDDPSPDVATTCGRQVGKTETGGAIAADAFITSHGYDVMIAAKWQETADELLRRAKQHLGSAGLTESHPDIVSWNKREIESVTGARLYSRTLQSNEGDAGDNQRGKLPKVIIVDESALVTHDVMEQVIEPMFATHGFDHELYLFSTPRGKSGYHYEAHFDPDISSHHIPTTESPLIDDAWLEQRRQKVDTLTWRQEYLGEFVEEGNAYLPHAIVDPCIDPDAVGRPDANRYLGVDVARAGRDRTVLIDLDVDGVIRRIHAEDVSRLTEIVGRITAWHDEVGYQAIAVDENGIGGGVVDFGKAGLGGVVQEVAFTLQSKQDMYQRLKKSLEDEALALPNDRRLIQELTSLQFSYTQHGKLRISHPDGGHDDFPDALALANLARTSVLSHTLRRRTARGTSHNILD